MQMDVFFFSAIGDSGLTSVAVLQGSVKTLC